MMMIEQAKGHPGEPDSQTLSLSLTAAGRLQAKAAPPLSGSGSQWCTGGCVCVGVVERQAAF